ncbi:MAG TPA: ATP-binding protein, partial [Phycisphaerae bacterium]|nr:ATP-binding protein [Phycisphaerae bacterium]
MIHAVQEGTSQLLAWDAHYFTVRRPGEDDFHTLHIVDTINGEKRASPTAGGRLPNLSESLRPLLNGEPVLLNRAPGESEPALHRLGDVRRPSASLMYVPVRSGKNVIGILSAQSYTPLRYNETDLRLLMQVADMVAPALDRAYAEEALRRARDELETRVRQRTADLTRVNESLTREFADRKRAEDELSLKNLVFDSSIAANSIADLGGSITQCNAAFLRVWGYQDKHEVIGKRVSDFLQDRDKATAILTALDTNGEWDGDYTAKRKDGSTFIAHGLATVVRDESGVVVGYQSAVNDITERIRAEEERAQLQAQLRHAQKLEAVGLLAGGISHEFNNILTVILGNSDRALRASGAKSAQQDPTTIDALKEIRHAAERAATLTKQLLTFSRKHKALRPQMLDPRQVVIGTENMLRQVIGEGIRLRIVLEPGQYSILAVAGEIEQAILNLAINARDAMPQGGRITIQVTAVDVDDKYVSSHIDAKPGPHVVIAVSDTGTGMDEDTLSHLFEPFFTTKPVGKGTGLGLAMVYGIVRQANGHVTVESIPGEGSTFRLLFPAVQGGALIEEQSVPQAHVGGNEIVLLCEDDLLVRRLARRVLEGHGYQVIEADNG